LLAALPLAGCGDNDNGRQWQRQRTGGSCGLGVVDQSSEQRDGSDLDGATCAVSARRRYAHLQRLVPLRHHGMRWNERDTDAHRHPAVGGLTATTEPTSTEIGATATPTTGDNLTATPTPGGVPPAASRSW
jgi:hypothetical protein